MSGWRVLLFLGCLLTPSPLSFSVWAYQGELNEALNAGLQRLSKTGVIQGLELGWFGSSDTRKDACGLGLSPVTDWPFPQRATHSLARVLDGGVLRISHLGMSFPPWLDCTNCNDTTDVNDWFGFEKSLLEEIVAVLAEEYEKPLRVDWNVVSLDLADAVGFFEAIIASLRTNCDVFVNAVTILPSRAEREVHFTCNYATVSLAAIRSSRTSVKLDNVQDFNKTGVIISVQRGTTNEDFVRSCCSAATIIPVSDFTSQVTSIEENMADLAITDSVTVWQWYRENRDTCNCRLVTFETDAAENYGLVVRDEDSFLGSMENAASPILYGCLSYLPLLVFLLLVLGL